MTEQGGRTWLKSLGGPLIAVPRSVAPAWSGTDGPGGEEDPDEEETDYWRACLAPDPVGVIDVAGKPALVLRTSSVPTAYVEEYRLFVHEMAKTDAPDTVAGATSLLSRVQWKFADTFTADESLILFDASFPGQYALEHEHLLIAVPPGDYSVESAYHKPVSPDGVWVTLVRLK
jgi:Immunity protein 21